MLYSKYCTRTDLGGVPPRMTPEGGLPPSADELLAHPVRMEGAARLTSLAHRTEEDTRKKTLKDRMEEEGMVPFIRD